MVSILSYLFGFTCLVWFGRAGLPVALPDVFLACLLPFALRNWLKRKAEVHLWLNRGYYLALLGLCWATVSCAAAAGLGGGLLKACQLGWYLLAGPFVVAMLPEERGRMMKGLAIGLVVNAIAACVMPFWGTIGGPCGGLMVSRTGFGVGMAIALSLLLLRDVLPMAWVTAPWGSVALMLCGLSLSGLSGIVLCCLAIAMSYRNGFIIRERQLHLAPFLAAVLLMLLISPDRRAALVDCVTPSEKTELSEASPRRWVQERICAWRAIKDSPCFGFGPGQYQATVGMARFRGRFPRPNETKVELNTQDGWQVVSVEYGFVAAVLIAAGFIVLFLNSLRRKNVVPDAARIGLFLFLGMFFTPLLVKGAGMLVALALGVMLQAKQQAAAVAAAVAENTESSDDKKVASSHTCWATGLNKLGISWSLLRQPLPLFALWGAALVLMAAAHRMGALSMSEDVGGSEELASGAFVSIVEAETLLNIAKPFEIHEDAACSGGRLVEIPDRILEDDAALRQVGMTYPLEMQEAKTLHLWMRARWKDGCGNSVYVSWDGATPSLAGNDGTYQAWHWIYGGDVNLTAGKHELALLPSEDGVEIDQLILCDDSQFRPRGVMSHEKFENGKSFDGNDLTPLQAALATAAPLAEAPQAAEKPLLFGTAGPYRGGFEGMLIKYGMPFRPLMDYELELPEKVAELTCIMISDPMNQDFEKMTATLIQFVENGGTLVIEKCDTWMGTLRRGTPLYPRRFWRHIPPGGVMKADDSWPFAGLEPGTELPLAHDVSMQLLHDRGANDWKPHGMLKMGDREIAGGIWERTLGKGRVLYFAAPMAFQTMWRDRHFEPVLKNILQNIAAANGRKSLWTGWKAQLLTPSEPCFTDDFMRDGNQPGGGWRVLSGAFVCPGDKPPMPNGEFTLECKEPGEIAVGDDGWKNYAFSYSILGKGVTTLKLKTTAGREVTVRYNSGTQGRALDVAGTAMKASGNATLEEVDRWHRVAVLCRNGSVEMYCDGEAVNWPSSGKLLLDGETFAGEAKLSFDTAGMLLDDVSVRSVDDILPNTGRAIGEEGSCLSLARMQDDGIEPYTVFTPYVNGRPSRETMNGFTIPLPLFKESKLLVNGKAYTLPPSRPDQVWTMPEDNGAEWFVACPAWKDYVFKGRLTDWYGTGDGHWESLQRWSCDRNWSWLGVETATTAALWHRQTMRAPFAVRTWISMGARDTFAAEYERGRDLNLVFGGNGKDLTEGWTVRVMRALDRGVELWHGGQLVAQNKEFGMGRGHTLHHSWYEIAAVVEEGRIRVYYEGRQVIDAAVDEKEFKGQLGVWTESNSIRLGRMQIAF